MQARFFFFNVTNTLNTCIWVHRDNDYEHAIGLYYHYVKQIFEIEIKLSYKFLRNNFSLWYYGLSIIL